MPHDELIGSDEASVRLGIDRSTLTRWITAGKITPALQMPGPTGAFLFTRADVERLAADREQKAAFLGHMVRDAAKAGS